MMPREHYLELLTCAPKATREDFDKINAIPTAQIFIARSLRYLGGFLNG